MKVPAVIIGPHLTSARPPCRRFLRARQFHVQKALDFFWAPCQARNDSSFVRFYENVDVVDYEETRKLFMAWTGCRDKRGLTICLFDMKYLTSNLGSFKKSCDFSSIAQPTPTGLPSAVTLRAVAVFEGMVRFVWPLCSRIRKRPSPEVPIFQATVIADISAVSLMQIWRIRSWLQLFSKLLADA